jgi:cytochrome c oxidase subunit 2
VNTVAFLTSYQSALDPAGPDAAAIEKLWWFFFAVCAVAWVGVVIMLAAAIRRGLKRPEPDETEEGSRRSTRWVSLALGTTVLLLLALLIASVVTGRAVSPLGRRVTQEIKITGHQWWWEIQYDHPRPDQIVQTANELHVPAGERVRLTLTSTDVIHSFWVPNLHGKQDLIPGKQAVFTIQGDRPGIYRAQCAEFCGAQHANMALVVVVEPRAKFDRWLAHHRAPAPHPKTADQQRGQQVFLTTSCVLCHAIKGTIAGARTGPDLTHIGSRRTLGAGILPNNRGTLHGWISNAQALKPGVLMPPNNFDAADLHALVAYMESLR